MELQGADSWPEGLELQGTDSWPEGWSFRGRTAGQRGGASGDGQLARGVEAQEGRGGASAV